MIVQSLFWTTTHHLAHTIHLCLCTCYTLPLPASRRYRYHMTLTEDLESSEGTKSACSNSLDRHGCFRAYQFMTRLQTLPCRYFGHPDGSTLASTIARSSQIWLWTTQGSLQMTIRLSRHAHLSCGSRCEVCSGNRGRGCKSF